MTIIKLTFLLRQYRYGLLCVMSRTNIQQDVMADIMTQDHVLYCTSILSYEKGMTTQWNG